MRTTGPQGQPCRDLTTPTPPSEGDPAPAFSELRRLRDEAEQRLGKPLPILSMGMSGDFEAALGAGSSMLRLGQALFGPRATLGARRTL